MISKHTFQPTITKCFWAHLYMPIGPVPITDYLRNLLLRSVDSKPMSFLWEANSNYPTLFDGINVLHPSENEKEAQAPEDQTLQFFLQ